VTDDRTMHGVNSVKSLERFEVWRWRKMKKISLTDRVTNEILQGVKEERNILQTIKTRKDKCIGQSLHRNCLLKYVIKAKITGRIDVTGRRRRMYKQLLDNLK
jgi:hypothetical protein